METYKKYMLTFSPSSIDTQPLLGGSTYNKQLMMIILILIIYGSLQYIQIPQCIIFLFTNRITNLIILSFIIYYNLYHNKVIGVILYMLYLLTYHYIGNNDKYQSFSHIENFNYFIHKKTNDIYLSKHRSNK